MIKSFKDELTNSVWNRKRVKKIPSDIFKVARRKLGFLEDAVDINDLHIPPGNRLEALKRNRVGPHCIRINDQWRVCFQWKDGNTYDVEITDYH
jgi:toxin HigB-1